MSAGNDAKEGEAPPLPCLPFFPPRLPSPPLPPPAGLPSLPLLGLYNRQAWVDHELHLHHPRQQDVLFQAVTRTMSGMGRPAVTARMRALQNCS